MSVSNSPLEGVQASGKRQYDLCPCRIHELIQRQRTALTVRGAMGAVETLGTQTWKRSEKLSRGRNGRLGPEQGVGSGQIQNFLCKGQRVESVMCLGNWKTGSGQSMRHENRRQEVRLMWSVNAE